MFINNELLGTSDAVEKSIAEGAQTRFNIRKMDMHTELGRCSEDLVRLITGKPLHIMPDADRRRTNVCPSAFRLLKALKRIFAVTEKTTFRHHEKMFDKAGWRQISRAELERVSSLSRNQLTKYLRVFEVGGWIERSREFNPNTEKTTLFLRLRADKIMADFDRIQVAKKGAMLIAPPVLLHKHTCIIHKERVDELSTGSLSSISLSASQGKGNVAVPALVPPLEEGDPEFRKLTALIHSKFPDEPWTYKHNSRVRSYACNGMLSRRMSLPKLQKYFKLRPVSLSDGAWQYTCGLEVFLNSWPLILKKMQQEDLVMSGADFASATLNSIKTAEQDLELEVQNVISHIQIETAYYPFRDDHKLPAVVAYHRLGMQNELAELIKTDANAIRLSMTQSPSFGLQLRKLPELASMLDVKPWMWSAMQQRATREFESATNLKASAEVWGLKV